jgi:DNA-binding FadR family transcriptional regulator
MVMHKSACAFRIPFPDRVEIRKMFAAGNFAIIMNVNRGQHDSFHLTARFADEFRSAVECAAAELAAAKGATGEALKELTDLAKASCSPDNRGSCVRFIEADTAFHVGIALLARNQMLVKAEPLMNACLERAVEDE